MNKKPILEGKECSHGNCRNRCHVVSNAKEKKPLKRTYIKKKPFKAKEGADELSVWFSEKMANSAPICENCGQWLGGLSEEDWKGSQHHILEKSLFPSVKTHPLNHLVLGRWCCHPQWHTSMLNASKMKVFSKARQIVSQLIDLLPNEERKKISSYYNL